MKFLSYTFETQLAFDEPVSNHSFLLRCQPKTTPKQTVMETQVIVTPHVGTVSQLDGFGNRLKTGYLAESHESFSFLSYGLVMVDEKAVVPEPAHPMFLQSSAYTVPTDEMAAWAQDVIKDLAEDPWACAQALMAAVSQSFTYIQGVTGVHTTAQEAFAMRQGVCQDYAQVLITLCRCVGIPARYCVGLMKGEGATHAWVEIHDGQNWRGLDPTNNKLVDEDYILFSCGRDFEDCSIERGMFLGSTMQTQTVTASVSEEDIQQ